MVGVSTIGSVVDYQRGPPERLIGSVSSTAVPAMALTKIADVSSRRCAISFYADTGIAWITDQPDAAPGTGIPVTPSSPLTLDRERFGDLVRHQFFASSLSGTVNVGVIPVEEA